MVVIICPVQAEHGEVGVLCVRRAIPPHIGELALPGGFLEAGESWRRGALRELREETGIDVNHELRVVEVESTPDGELLLVFATTDVPLPMSALASFEPNSEISAVEVVDTASELCFPLHRAVLAHWFEGRVTPTRPPG